MLVTPDGMLIDCNDVLDQNAWSPMLVTASLNAITPKPFSYLWLLIVVPKSFGLDILHIFPSVVVYQISSIGGVPSCARAYTAQHIISTAESKSLVKFLFIFLRFYLLSRFLSCKVTMFLSSTKSIIQTGVFYMGFLKRLIFAQRTPHNPQMLFCGI